jgi:hypothetical protein
VKITGPCPQCGKTLKLAMNICDANAAEFLEGVPAECAKCGKVFLEWNAIDFLSLRYRGGEEAAKP